MIIDFIFLCPFGVFNKKRTSVKPAALVAVDLPSLFNGKRGRYNHSSRGK